MNVRINPRRLSGPVTPPPSNSLAHRLVIAAALAAAIEEGVGVPVERQYWLEESEWTRKESERG